MPPGGAPELYRVGDLLVDVTGASVSRHGERIVLPPRTFELLVALVRHHPATVRRHDLLDTVWPDENVTDQTLSHRVMVLRKALGDHAEEPIYVGGERGFGYLLVAPVERIGTGAGEPPRADAGAAGSCASRAATAILAMLQWRVGSPGRAATPRRAGISSHRRRASTASACAANSSS
jgi:DNA-binding winged helix-turn-helix (wHTH) protein